MVIPAMAFPPIGGNCIILTHLELLPRPISGYFGEQLFFYRQVLCDGYVPPRAQLIPSLGRAWRFSPAVLPFGCCLSLKAGALENRWWEGKAWAAWKPLNIQQLMLRICYHTQAHSYAGILGGTNEYSWKSMSLCTSVDV